MLSVDGAPAVALQSVSGCSTPRFNQPPLDCEVVLARVPQSPVLTWIAAYFKGGLPLTRSVELTKYDLNGNVLGRLTLADAFIHRASLEDLNGADPKGPTFLTLRLTSDRITRSTPGGTITLPSTGPSSGPRPPMASDFRLTANVAITQATQLDHLGFETAVVPSAGPNLPRTPGAVTVDVARLEVGANDAVLRPWIADVLATGKQRDLKVELLNAALDATVMTWTIRDAAPLGDVEPFATGSSTSETAGRYSLELQGARVTLTAP